MSDVRVVQIENEIRMKAPVEKVWDAMTTKQLEWYPHTYGGDRVKGLVFEERVGGQIYEDWGGKAGKLYGVIDYFDPPRSYVTRGYLGGGILLEQRIVLESEGGETVLKASTMCFGQITDDMEGQIRLHGSLDNYADTLREYVEGSAKKEAKAAGE